MTDLILSSISHRIKLLVWSIYLHLVDLYGKLVGTVNRPVPRIMGFCLKFGREIEILHNGPARFQQPIPPLFGHPKCWFSN